MVPSARMRESPCDRMPAKTARYASVKMPGGVLSELGPSSETITSWFATLLLRKVASVSWPTIIWLGG
jgi:hypothetical protein